MDGSESDGNELRIKNIAVLEILVGLASCFRLFLK